MRIAIGIDLGGTSIKGGLINEAGEILERCEIETGDGVGHIEVLRRISSVIKVLLTDEVVGISRVGQVPILGEYCVRNLMISLYLLKMMLM